MKAVLVIDMPTTCAGCPCYDYIHGVCANTHKDCELRKQEKPTWCPIKPLTQIQKMETPIAETIPIEWMEVWLAEHEAWDFRTTFIDMINDWRNGETE